MFPYHLKSFQNVLKHYETDYGMKQAPAFYSNHRNYQFFCLNTYRAQLERRFNRSMAYRLGVLYISVCRALF